MTDRSVSLLRDAFARVYESVPEVLSDLDEEQLAWSPGPHANPISWLIWHLARVQDDHLASIAGHDQVWLADGWCERFALPLDPHDIGYGQTADEVRQVVASAGDLQGYYSAVHTRTNEILDTLTDADFDRIVDERWDPPVTAAIRLVSVVNDVTQHVGQAAYVRGLLPS